MAEPVPFKLPSLGADMEKATLVEWLVKPGDRVVRGGLIAVVETDKGAMDLEVFDAGVVRELLVEEGTVARVGTPLALIDPEAGTVGGTPEVPVATAPVAAPAPVAARPSPAPTSPVAAPVASPTRAAAAVWDPVVLASPAARGRARELGVDLRTVRGTGPGGAVILADLDGLSAAAPPVAPAPVAPVPTDASPEARMRAAIGAAMARSKREIPHYYLQTEFDVSPLQTWLEAFNADRPPETRVLVAAALLRATALAAMKYPGFNGHWVDGAFRPTERVHLGVAVSLRTGGLVAPAIHDAHTLSLPDLMAALSDVVERARAGRLRGSEMSDATLTVTNLGQQGVPSLFGVIVPPQVAIVGFGRVEERPWVVDGQVVARPVLSATLAADHRVTDGHVGGLFLRRIERLMARPEEL